MKDHVARKIVEAGQTVGEDRIELRESYSGRGMYSERTAAVVVSDWGLFTAAVALAAVTIDPDDHNDLFEACLALRSDNLGDDFIVY